MQGDYTNAICLRCFFAGRTISVGLFFLATVLPFLLHIIQRVGACGDDTACGQQCWRGHGGLVGLVGVSCCACGTCLCSGGWISNSAVSSMCRYARGRRNREFYLRGYFLCCGVHLEPRDTQETSRCVRRISVPRARDIDSSTASLGGEGRGG